MKVQIGDLKPLDEFCFPPNNTRCYIEPGLRGKDGVVPWQVCGQSPERSVFARPTVIVEISDDDYNAQE